MTDRTIDTDSASAAANILEIYHVRCDTIDNGRVGLSSGERLKTPAASTMDC